MLIRAGVEPIGGALPWMYGALGVPRPRGDQMLGAARHLRSCSKSAVTADDREARRTGPGSRSRVAPPHRGEVRSATSRLLGTRSSLEAKAGNRSTHRQSLIVMAVAVAGLVSWARALARMSPYRPGSGGAARHRRVCRSWRSCTRIKAATFGVSPAVAVPSTPTGSALAFLFGSIGICCAVPVGQPMSILLSGASRCSPWAVLLMAKAPAGQPHRRRPAAGTPPVAPRRPRRNRLTFLGAGAMANGLVPGVRSRHRRGIRGARARAQVGDNRVMAKYPDSRAGSESEAASSLRPRRHERLMSLRHAAAGAVLSALVDPRRPPLLRRRPRPVRGPDGPHSGRRGLPGATSTSTASETPPSATGRSSR